MGSKTVQEQTELKPLKKPKKRTANGPKPSNRGEYTQVTESHPYAKANWLSRFLFLWFWSYSRKGARSELTVDAVPDPLPKEESEKQTNILKENYARYCEEGSKHPLWRAFISMFWHCCSINWIIIIIYEIIQIVQVILLHNFLEFFSNEIKFSTAIIYASAMCFCLFLGFVLNHFYFWKCSIIGNRIRVTFSGLVFDKLKKLYMSDIARRDLLNTIVNDLVYKLEDQNFIENFPYIFIAPCQLAFISWYLSSEIHPAFLIGVAFIALMIGLITALAPVLDKLRDNLNTAKTKRSGMTSEILEIVKIIKMYCLESFYLKKLSKLRSIEMIYQKWIHMISAFNCILEIDLSVFVTFLSVLFLYLFTSVTLKPIYVVYSMAFYPRLCVSFGYFFAKAVKYYITYSISITEIQKYLNYADHESSFLAEKSGTSPAVEMQNVTIDFQNDKNESTFKIGPIDLNIAQRELWLVTGSGSSGKTSVLLSMIGECPLKPAGSIYDDTYSRLHGRYFYVPQKPWIFSGTILDNILFNSKLDPDKLVEVLNATCLLQDLCDERKFADGVNTVVQEEGRNLSGGQKSRISLARALYKRDETDVYLLDDPLVGIDAELTNIIRNNCIYEYLQEKTRVIATNDSRGWANFKSINLTRQDEARVSEINISDYLIVPAERDDLITEDSASIVKFNLEELKEKIKVQTDQHDKFKSTGSNNEFDRTNISWKVYLKFIRAGYKEILTLLLVLYFLATQVAAIYSDYFISNWSIYEQYLREHNNSTMQFSNSTFGNSSMTNLTKSFGFLFFKANSSTSFDSLRSIFFKEYAIWVGISLFMIVTRPFLFYYMCVRISKRLYKDLSKSVIHKFMSFFDERSRGEIETRFMNDFKNIDENIPATLFDFVQIFSFVTATFGLAIYLNYFVVIPLFFLAIVLFLFRRYYIKTSRALRRLTLKCQAPVTDTFYAIANGIATIRACKQVQVYEDAYHKNMNCMTKVNYLYLTLKRWFCLWFDMIVLVFVIIVVFGSLLLKTFNIESGNLNSANIGILLAYLFQLGVQFQYCIRQSCEVENQMISVERILEYVRDKESDETRTPVSRMPSSNWPTKGQISLRELCFRYKKNSPPVINNLSLDIDDHEKIGIIGRTGSGKSSIFMALLRMAPIDAGSVFIDEVDISEISLKELRSKITNIPQEATLLTATLRENLFPHIGDLSETERQAINTRMNELLRTVGLHKFCSRLNDMVDRNDSCFTTQYIVSNQNGENTSEQQGNKITNSEKQILSVIRAILNDTKIYLIDEATSNMDKATERTIMKLLATELHDKTILTIAHRLLNLANSSNILSLKTGGLKEDYRPPLELINDNNSLFYKYCDNADLVDAMQIDIQSHLSS